MDVLNQAPPFQDYNLYSVDPLMAELDLPEPAQKRLRNFGEKLGRAENIELGFLANQNPPDLHTHDRYGHRADRVDFHPSYHRLMSLGAEFGVHCLPWTADEVTVDKHLERAAGHAMLTQIEASVLCPLTMTFAGVPALRRWAPQSLTDSWLPGLTAKSYDPRFVPHQQKSGLTMGMAMTEKQGGSDVRANITTATPDGGDSYLLNGHKWFCSAPMSDAFLTLAQAEEGLTCFFVPRFCPDGQVNNLRLMRLKNKLGNKANASSEIEYENTYAVRVGELGRGVPTIIEMVNHTRLDCVIGSTAIMRAALVQALHHARHRSVFGKKLIEQPLMRNVLADLCLEWEAAWKMVVRLCQAYGRADQDPKEKAFARIATAVAKFWVCKRTPMMVAEALECLGGNGYIEDFPQARLYREAPLSSVWEGSGNVISLDLLRVLSHEPDALRAFLAELSTSDRVTGQILQAQVMQETTAFKARRFAEALALRWQDQLMQSSSTPGAPELFFESRLEKGSAAFGLLSDEKKASGVLERFFASIG